MSWLLSHSLQGFLRCWITSTLIQGQTAKKMRAKFLSRKTSDGEHIPGPGDFHQYFTILTRPSTPSVIYRIVLTFERQNMTKTSSKSSVGETIIKIHLNK